MAGTSLDLALELPQAILDHHLGQIGNDFPRDVADHPVADQLDHAASDAVDVFGPERLGRGGGRPDRRLAGLGVVTGEAAIAFGGAGRR